MAQIYAVICVCLCFCFLAFQVVSKRLEVCKLFRTRENDSRIVDTWYISYSSHNPFVRTYAHCLLCRRNCNSIHAFIGSALCISFHSLGAKQNVVETNRAQLVGKYMGETPKLVNRLCDQAMGGVLFIDEAYALCAGSDDQYGREAVDTLARRMDDDRGKFVVIIAGYKDRIEAFLADNQSLASCFTHRMQIDDYNEDELLAIVKKMAAHDEYQFAPDAEFKMLGLICQKVMSRGTSFGNAREMRLILDEIIGRLSERVAKMNPAEITSDTYKIITSEDII